MNARLKSIAILVFGLCLFSTPGHAGPRNSGHAGGQTPGTTLPALPDPQLPAAQAPSPNKTNPPTTTKIPPPSTVPGPFSQSQTMSREEAEFKVRSDRFSQPEYEAMPADKLASQKIYLANCVEAMPSAKSTVQNPHFDFRYFPEGVIHVFSSGGHNRDTLSIGTAYSAIPGYFSQSETNRLAVRNQLYNSYAMGLQNPSSPVKKMLDGRTALFFSSRGVQDKTNTPYRWIEYSIRRNKNDKSNTDWIVLEVEKTQAGEGKPIQVTHTAYCI